MCHSLSAMSKVFKSAKLIAFGFSGGCTQLRNAASLSASKMKFDLNTKPKAKPESYEDIVFGSVFTDHMLTIEWDSKRGFHAPHIKPFGDLSLHPAVSSLHYGLQLFEGMKAYRSMRTGKVNLFRPKKNIARLNQSASRIALPFVDSDEFLACMSELVSLDQDWVPHSRRASLYMRPTYISTQPTLGVSPPHRAMLFVLLSPVGPYFKTGTFQPVRLLADTQYVRAWEGGTGKYKLGGNYGATIGIQKKAEKLNCQQLLWLYGPKHHLTEVGAMNIFVYWTNKDGEKELVTPPLSDLILPGVTRDSILELTDSWDEFQVEEKKISMPEVYQAALDGRLHEVFGAGTACCVCPVKSILYQRSLDQPEIDIEIPFDEKTSLAKRIYDSITAIQYDEVDSEWSVAIEDVISESKDRILASSLK